MPGIVVGVDGSEASLYALRWALREAAHHRVPLTAVSVHPPPARPATRIYWAVAAYPDQSFDRDEAQTAVQDLVAGVASGVGGAPPDVTAKVVVGDAAQELVSASRDADLLVVGARGSGGFSKLTLGSVSNKVTHHALCPVVVVPVPMGQ